MQQVDDADKPPVTLLNVSYDPTRELYVEFNKEFAKHWQEETGPGRHDRAVARRRRHAGPRRDRRPEGRRRHARHCLRHRSDRRDRQVCCPPIGRRACRNNSCPYTSTIVFLVRKGNPEGNQGLERPGEGRRRGHHAESEDLGRRSLQLPGRLGLRPASTTTTTKRRPASSSPRCIKNVPVLDSGARGSTTTFVQRGIGDVLLAWENEALLAIKELGPDKVEMVVPSVSILAEPPVTVVDKNAEAHGTTEVATAYLEYLYSPAGQKIVGQALLSPERAELRRPGSAEAVPRNQAVHASTKCSAAGRKPRRSTSTTAACSTRSTRRSNDACNRVGDASHIRLQTSVHSHVHRTHKTQRPARLRPDDGLHGAVPEPDRADSAGGARDQEHDAWAGTASGQPRGTRASSPRTS